MTLCAVRAAWVQGGKVPHHNQMKRVPYCKSELDESKEQFCLPRVRHLPVTALARGNRRSCHPKKTMLTPNEAGAATVGKAPKKVHTKVFCCERGKSS